MTHAMTIRSLVGTMFLALLPLSLPAQTIGELFGRMPDDLTPFFPDSAFRRTLIEEVPIGVRQTNAFGGEMVVEERSDHRLVISPDESCRIEMALLPLSGREPLICLIATSLLTPHQSVVAFFDTTWQRQEKEGTFTIPDAEMFLKAPSDTKAKQALMERGHLNWVATLSGEEVKPRLTLRITSFDDETADELHPEMREKLREVTLLWSRESACFVIHE